MIFITVVPGHHYFKDNDGKLEREKEEFTKQKNVMS